MGLRRGIIPSMAIDLAFRIDHVFTGFLIVIHSWAATVATSCSEQGESDCSVHQLVVQREWMTKPRVRAETKNVTVT